MSVLAQERDRQEALGRYDLPDLPAEPELQAIMRVAATVAGVPTATLNLLDDSMVCAYVTQGFDGGSSPRSDAMCDVTFREGRVQHVPDARLDPRFASNPYVDGRLAAIRFYAAAPLVTDDGFTLGTLCVFDSEPHVLRADQQRVLVVDDGDVNRLVAVGLLEVLGATADAVDCGEAALARVQQASYDVVLLDHHMPGMDGPATARAIAALPGAGPRLVGLTGTTQADELAQCRAAGMQTVLVKPLRPDDLLAALS